MRWAADVVIACHLGYLGYVVCGGFLAWHWPRTIVVHVTAVVWGALIVFTPVPCPLTTLQNELRERAGQRPLADSFIDLYVRGHFVPQAPVGSVQVVVGVLVLASWLGFVARHRPARRASSATP
jgi:hypothetical protein